jgi:hypothetical protein
MYLFLFHVFLALSFRKSKEQKRYWARMHCVIKVIFFTAFAHFPVKYFVEN